MFFFLLQQPNLGMSYPNGTCAEKYFCRRSSVSATPGQGEDANICPQGMYCPAMTGEPQRCDKGTFNSRTGWFFLCIII